VLVRSLSALGILAAIALVSGVRSARAADTVPVRVVIDAPEGCSSVRAFFEAVRARTERIHLATRPREGFELRVSVARAHDKVRGELRVLDERGVASTRSVEGTSCEEVVRALSLTAALVVDQLAPPAAEAPAPARSATGSPSATRGADPQAPSRGSETTPSVTTPPRSEAERAEREYQAERERVRAEREREAERAREEEREEAERARENAKEATPFVDPELYDNASEQPRVFVVDVGAAGLVGEIVSPRISVGGALFVTLSDTSERVFSPSFGLAIAHIPAEFAQSGGDVSVRWTAAIASICPLRLRSGPVSLHPCAFGTGGFLNARGETSKTPRTASRSWWSAGALGRMVAEIGGGTSARVELGMSVPFYRRRFVTTPPEETVGESPEVSVLGALGVAHVF
jgi:hypothetical protein